MPITNYYKGITLKYILNKSRKEIIKRKEMSKKVEEYKALITKQFDELEAMMNKQMHLTDPQTVEEKMYSE